MPCSSQRPETREEGSNPDGRDRRQNWKRSPCQAFRCCQSARGLWRPKMADCAPVRLWSQRNLGAPREDFWIRFRGMIVDDLKTDALQTETQTESRRDFLFIATGAVAAVGTVAAIWPLIDQMQPDAATIAAGAPLDVDVGLLAAGQQIIVKWRGHPIFIVNRPPDAWKALQDPALVGMLADPNSRARQQPGYADNWHRSLKPELAVLVGICTHLGLYPDIRTQQEPVGSRVARRMVLSLPRLEIRSRGKGFSKCAGSL